MSGYIRDSRNICFNAIKLRLSEHRFSPNVIKLNDTSRLQELKVIVV